MRQKLRAANIQKMKPAVSKIEVYVDELILHGFSVSDRYIIGDAFGHELGQLVENGISSTALIRGAHIPKLNAGQIVLPSNVKPSSVGVQVAQAVYGSLNNAHRGNQR